MLHENIESLTRELVRSTIGKYRNAKKRSSKNAIGKYRIAHKRTRKKW